MRSNRHAIFALAAVAALSVASCDITEGLNGTLSFDDTTTGSAGFDRALAVGATMVIRVSCGPCIDESVIDADASDAGVFTVVGFSSDEVTVRGIAPGTARLSVDVEDVFDEIDITVDNAVDASVRLEPWPDFASLPTELWDGGFAMLADSTIDVRAFPKDANGDRLTGFGAVEWTVDGGAQVEGIADRRDDTVLVTAPAEAGASFSLTPSVGSAQTIGVVTEADVASVELAVITEPLEIVQEAGSFTMESDDSLFMQLVARTNDGTYVSGPGAELSELTIGEGLTGAIVDLGGTVAADPEADPEEVRQARESFERGYLIGTTGQVGEGDLTFTWGDHTLTVHLTVVSVAEPDGSGS